VGSRQFAGYVKNALAAGISFRAMVLLDMVADSDQQFYWEGNSDPTVRAEIWSTAKELGYGREFIPSVRYTMLDDHLPFRDLGIPSVDIIDFDYPYWHTAEDTLDKISAESLGRIGRTIEVWLEKGA
jgi:Zn-dependent M28 family amino/carboxypeptidase